MLTLIQKAMQDQFLDAPILTEPSIEIYVNVMKRLTPVIKPVGNACNSRCIYCFYSGRHPTTMRVMDDSLREEVIRNSYHGMQIELTSFGMEANHCWLELNSTPEPSKSRKNTTYYKSISNSFQTNGTLLNDEWVSFCFDNKFDIGISLMDALIAYKQRSLIGEVNSYKLLDKAFDLMQMRGMKVNVYVWYQALTLLVEGNH
jgi:uncharacterized protein